MEVFKKSLVRHQPSWQEIVISMTQLIVDYSSET